jgi:ligand-binding sensor domain-containing protein
MNLITRVSTYSNKFGCLVVLYLFLSITAIAQQKNLKFQHLGIREGLSHSNVRGILQDRQGYMWFSTHDGLNKYDGYKFTVYKNIPNDSTSLSHNNIWRIIEDRNGNIWIAAWGGRSQHAGPEDGSFYTLQTR